MSDVALHVQMLGGFSLQLGNKPVGQIPLRYASLLAYLILHRDRDHTRDLLAGRFWSETTDDKARRNLSQALWRIRKTFKEFGVDPLLSTSSHVQLNPAMEVVLDAEVFVDRLDEFERRADGRRGNPTPADLGAIVDSYRGSLLAGYYHDWIAEEREVLQSRYRASLRQLIALSTRGGDFDTALRHAVSLAKEEPFDEMAERQVLRLFAMTGQAAAAERHYEEFAKQLDGEPSEETVDLIRAIIDDAEAPPLGLVDRDRNPTAFIGRRPERSALLNRVRDLVGGKGGIVLVEGEPGVGKTRLADELAVGARWREAQVLLGGHTETSALTPYDGLRKALAPATTGLRGQRLKDTVDDLWLVGARSVLDGLGKLVAGNDRQQLRPAERPWQTAEALAQIVLALGTPKPTVLILEDIHRCDDDTMAVLTQLGDRLIDSQVLICLTYQLRQAQLSTTIWDGLSALEASPGSSRIVLPPLADDEAHELIAAELGPGRMSKPMGDQLVAATGGNPYMLLELLRSPMELLSDEVLEAGGGLGPDRIEEKLRPRLSEIVTQRLEAVPSAARSVLESLAAIGACANSDVVAEVAGLDNRTTIDGLQQAIDLGFLAESDDGCDFIQDQTRRIVYENMPIEHRSELHGRIVDALTLADRPIRVAEIAHHAWQAGQWQRAYQYHSLAADSALKVNAFQTAAEHLAKADNAAQSTGLVDVARFGDLFEYEEVLDVLGRRNEQRRLVERLEPLALPPQARLKLDERRAMLLLNTAGAAEAAAIAAEAAARAKADGQKRSDLLTIVGTALARTGELSAAVAPLEEAIEEARSEGRQAVDAQLMLGRTHADLHDFDAAHRFLQDAYAETKRADDVRGQIEALGHLATMWVAQDVSLQAERAFSEALDLAREIGYRQGEGRNLLNLAVFHVLQGYGGRALGLYTEAEEVYASLGDERGVAFVKANKSWVLHWIMGDDSTARRLAEEAAMQLRSLGDGRTEAVCLYTIAAVERRAGQRRAARRRLAHALEQATAAEDRLTEARTLLNLALVEYDLAHHDEALDRLEAADGLRRAHQLDSMIAVVAALEAKARSALGQESEALQLTDRVILANNVASDLSHLAAWWCAEVLMDAEQHQAAAEQVALAFDLVSRQLEGVSPALVEASWKNVPEHAAILVAREKYFVEREVRAVPALDAPTGRPLQSDDLVMVTFTTSHPDDWDWLVPAERRQHRVLRLAAEAFDQGGAARQSDIASLLNVSERTIKRDLSALRAAGHQPVTRRGALPDASP